MNALWTSLSAREGLSDSGLRESVPAASEQALRRWIYNGICMLKDEGDQLMRRLDLVVPKAIRDEYATKNAEYRRLLKAREELIKREAQEAESRAAASSETQDESEAKAIVLWNPALATRYPFPQAPMDPRHRYVAFRTPRNRLLDIIDALLAQLPYKPPPPPAVDPVGALVRRYRMAVRGKEREELQVILDDARLIYRVRADGRGLERRVTALTTAAALTAGEMAEQAGYPTAATRLTEAWNKIYALKPDPGGVRGRSTGCRGRGMSALSQYCRLADAGPGSRSS